MPIRRFSRAVACTLLCSFVLSLCPLGIRHARADFAVMDIGGGAAGNVAAFLADFKKTQQGAILDLMPRATDQTAVARAMGALNGTQASMWPAVLQSTGPGRRVLRLNDKARAFLDLAERQVAAYARRGADMGRVQATIRDVRNIEFTYGSEPLEGWQVKNFFEALELRAKKAACAADDVVRTLGRSGRAADVAEFKPSRTASKVAASGAAETLRPSAASRAKNSLRFDLRGGLLADVAITTGVVIATRMSEGESFGEGVEAAGRYIATPTFLFGDLLGGVVGAALGAMVPVAGLAASGVGGAILGRIPVLGGAMLFANLGAAFVQCVREDDVSLRRILSMVDFPALAGQVLGAGVGSVLGTMFLPVPILGTVVGGVLGGLAGATLLSWLRDLTMEAFTRERRLRGSAGATAGAGRRTIDSSGCSPSTTSVGSAEASSQNSPARGAR